jgi:hypothetical protein
MARKRPTGSFWGQRRTRCGSGKRNRDYVSLATVGTVNLPAGNLITE